ncbi:MAG TPA: DNA translocase FtsK [Hyphomicrobiaceae bacterium]|nr:DNA translocase FtsK [Hyphomicrobiaceae bacterium]
MALHGSGYEPRPLLPHPLEERLKGSFWRLAGIVLAALTAAGWLSLISWSAADPSLTHAAGGATRNWMGPLGAIFSDLLLQSVGLAAIFGMVIPTFWCAELILRRRLIDARWRIVVAPFAVLLLAGALVALPPPASWPLHHGLGGAFGGMVLNLASSVFAMINPARAGLVAGLLLFAGGMCALSAALGLTQQEYALLWQRDPRAEPSMFGEAMTGLTQRLKAGRSTWRRSRSHYEFHDDPEFVMPTGPMMHYADGFDRAPLHRAPVQPAPDIADDDDQPITFDTATEKQSRLIAERFAPAGVRPQRGPSLDREPTFAPEPVVRRPEPAPQPAPPPRRRPSRPRGFQRPSLDILRRPPPSKQGAEINHAVMRGNARLLEDVLADFGVKGEIKDIRPGPVVTLYELVPARGTKSARVIALADDIARSMSAASARIAVVPGRNAIGIELPNARRESVFLRELLEAEPFVASEAHLPITLGKSIAGEPIVVDLARMPHLLIAGTTGSGKSVGVNALILSLLYRHSPETCRFLMIDPKMLELSAYNGIPHLLTPVVTDPHQAASALEWVVREMEERYRRMSKLGVRNIEMFNTRVRTAAERGEKLARRVQTGFHPETGKPMYESEPLDYAPMPFIVVVVDEFADLMVVAGKEVEGAVQRLAQMARAAGIHLIMATQRPSVDVITGTIKANFPTRISFKVASKIDSRTILNEQGAEQLLGAGDMLFSGAGSAVMRVHGPFVSDEEVEQVADHLRAQGEPAYVDVILDHAPEDEEQDPEDEADELFDRAVALVVREQKASTSFLQRRLAIGYNRAADLIERMEREGLVGPANHVGKREILLGPADRDDLD